MINNPTTVHKSGSPGIAGDVTLAQGTNVTLTQTGSTITIAASGGGGSFSIAAASVAFTDGDTFRRVTIADGAVTAATKFILGVRRPDTTLLTDKGYIYNANIVSIGTGTFDVEVGVTDMSGLDPVDDPPSETITLWYAIA